MSKRALSPSPHTSSSSSSSRSKQRCIRFQLLHALPASLLAEVCSFLSVYQVVSILRSTCHSMHSSVTPDCLLQSPLSIRGRSLPGLVASSPGTRAVVSRVASLIVFYHTGVGEEKEEDDGNNPHFPAELSDGEECDDEQYYGQRPESAMLRLQELRSPLDASRFLFSSLQSLHVQFEQQVHDCPQPGVLLSCLLGLLQLLAADAASFSSLRHLVINDYGTSTVDGAEPVDLPFSSLARLPALTDCSINLKQISAASCSSLLTALSSLQSLTSFNLGQNLESWPGLLQQLSADAATPLLLRLRSLILPSCYGNGREQSTHNAFLCRLSSLPAPPALQRFSGMEGLRCSAAGLLSIFSLPHLTQLDLGDHNVRRSDFLAFTSSLTSAPPLVSLVLPRMRPEPGDNAGEKAAAGAEAAAVRTAVRELCSRSRFLRRLAGDADTTGAAVTLPDGRQGSEASGCSGSLYSLFLQQRSEQLSRFLFTTRLSFPLLTELWLGITMEDAELELLLSACPQLLRLRCAVWQSWQAVHIAARCCPRLLDLTVKLDSEEDQPDRDAAFSAPEPVVGSPFLPQLLSLKLEGRPRAEPSSNYFSVLRCFTIPPHAQLQHVCLSGFGLTAQHLLPLAALPRLSSFRASSSSSPWIGRIAELEEASRRVRRRLLSRDAAGSADRDARKPVPCRDTDFGRLEQPPPLGPHQQLEMRQRVMDEAATTARTESNLLVCAEGVDASTVRAVFFAELQSVLAGASAN